MRKAFERIKPLYTGGARQDIAETLFNTGVITAAQALTGELTPEQLAVSAALGLGGGFAGRHYGGRLGTKVGTHLDKHYPQTMSDIKHQIGRYYNFIGEDGIGLRPGARMKFDASMEGHNPGEGVANLVGRTYGDNVLQALIGLGTYDYFNE